MTYKYVGVHSRPQVAISLHRDDFKMAFRTEAFAVGGKLHSCSDFHIHGGAGVRLQPVLTLVLGEEALTRRILDLGSRSTRSVALHHC